MNSQGIGHDSLVLFFLLSSRAAISLSHRFCRIGDSVASQAARQGIGWGPTKTKTSVPAVRISRSTSTAEVFHQKLSGFLDDRIRTFSSAPNAEGAMV
jgi:hypothetical protein